MGTKAELEVGIGHLDEESQQTKRLCILFCRHFLTGTKLTSNSVSRAAFFTFNVKKNWRRFQKIHPKLLKN